MSAPSHGRPGASDAPYLLDDSADGAIRAFQFLPGIDPVVRILVCGAFAVTVVSLQQLSGLVVALGLSLTALAFSGAPLRRTLKRMAAMDTFVVFVLLTLPFTVPGVPYFTLFGLEASLEGLQLGAAILLKANAIVLMALVQLGTLESVRFGHALGRLKVPPALVTLLLFTVRYIDVLHVEYVRARTAMRARAFKPRNNWHTYQSYGYLVGMLLIRAIERSERILAAMKCRGFAGKIYVLEEHRIGWRDLAFAGTSTVLFAAMLLWERL